MKRLFIILKGQVVRSGNYSMLTVALIKSIQSSANRMRNTQELNDYVSRNYSHNYSNLTNIIWRTLTKNNFFLKLNVRSGNHNYWTLDLDYDFSYNMPLKKSDILANKSIPSKSKKIQNFDENLQLSTQDPFLDKHLIFLIFFLFYSIPLVRFFL